MFTDESIMPFGKFIGIKLANVPDEYLLWLFRENKCFGELYNYIKENYDAIKKNASKKYSKGNQQRINHGHYN